jgi:hypothetical protein
MARSQYLPFITGALLGLPYKGRNRYMHAVQHLRAASDAQTAQWVLRLLLYIATIYGEAEQAQVV